MALAVRLVVNLGQRQGDALRLTWAQLEGDGFKIRQGRTAALIKVPTTRELAAAPEKTKRTSPSTVVSEITNQPYKADNFRAAFADIRKAAGLSDVRFRDLRRTAFVRLAEAGCSTAEIAAISGHSIETTQKIMEVYLPRNSTMARHAIAKLESYPATGKLEVPTVKLETESEEWCPGADLNHRHADFQSAALPTELPGRDAGYRGIAGGCPA